MTDLPIVCTLTPDTIRTRREELLPRLLREAQSHEELADGHRLRFAASAGTLSTIARVVDAERQCCRFLRFGITVDPDDGPITVDLTGPPGTREFVSALLDA